MKVLTTERLSLCSTRQGGTRGPVKAAVGARARPLLEVPRAAVATHAYARVGSAAGTAGCGTGQDLVGAVEAILTVTPPMVADAVLYLSVALLFLAVAGSANAAA